MSTHKQHHLGIGEGLLSILPFLCMTGRNLEGIKYNGEGSRSPHASEHVEQKIYIVGLSWTETI